MHLKTLNIFRNIMSNLTYRMNNLNLVCCREMAHLTDSECDDFGTEEDLGTDTANSQPLNVFTLTKTRAENFFKLVSTFISPPSDKVLDEEQLGRLIAKMMRAVSNIPD